MGPPAVQDGLKYGNTMHLKGRFILLLNGHTVPGLLKILSKESEWKPGQMRVEIADWRFDKELFENCKNSFSTKYRYSDRYIIQEKIRKLKRTIFF